MAFFYRPSDGVAADFVPFFWNGAYHLFYLKDYRDPEGHGEGTPWFHLVTQDLVTFEDWGEALPRGSKDAQDLWVFTGSVIEADGMFHIYYTGHNRHFQGQRPIQAVMHATSEDLRVWRKDPRVCFFAPTEGGYEQDDWRDPFVYRDDDTGQYVMLLAARKQEGPSRHRGLIARAVSDDLISWEVAEPLWSPDLYYTHECPDLFHWGFWWYLVYSTFSERCVTHYRMARSLDGPWLAPSNDTFDGRAYYAAKTAGDGTDRYVFGWLPTREGESDEGVWQWGGNLVAHRLKQREDGTLWVEPPTAVWGAFDDAACLKPRALLGTWEPNAGGWRSDAVGRYSAIALGAMPDECAIEATVSFSEGTVSCGLLLRASGDMNRYYQLRLEPGNRRVVVDCWPRPGDQPLMLERPLDLTSEGSVRFRVIVDGTSMVAYVDDVALSCRLYDHCQGELGLFVSEGSASFSDVRMLTRDRV